VVVIDTRSSAAQDAALVPALSDLIQVPSRPSILDLRAILDTIDIAKGAARRSLIVLNACPPPRGAGEASLTGDARRAVAAFGVPVAPVPVVNRTVFAGALLTGLTASEAEPGGKADKEMRALWRVVEKELNHGKGYAADRAGEEDGVPARTAAGVGG